MVQSTVRIHLDARAYELALEPAPADGLALHPSARTVLESAASDSGGSAVRSVRCTVAEARALLDYFSRLTDTMTAAGNADAKVCAAARDSVRRAIVAAG